MENTLIEWADHTFNFWFGCTKKILEDGSMSEECRNCYAEDMMDKRWGKVKWGKGQERVMASKSSLKKPFKWDKQAELAGERHRVFCSSLSDVFDEEVDPSWLGQLFEIIQNTPNLDWLILTKRPGNIMACEHFDGFKGALEKVMDLGGPGSEFASLWFEGAAPTNVWIGTSVGTMASARERIPQLLRVPAYVRFLSMEPLLEYVSISSFAVEEHSTYGFFHGGDPRDFVPDLENTPEEKAAWKKACAAWDANDKENDGVKPPVIVGQLVKDESSSLKTKSGVPYSEASLEDIAEGKTQDKEVVGSFIACGGSGLGMGVNVRKEVSIDWVIVGGESGRKARPMHPLWAIALRDECQELKIPFFFKQHGRWMPRDSTPMKDGFPVCVADPNMDRFESMEVDDGTGEIIVMQAVGKKKTGKVLEDREWCEYPTPPDHSCLEV